MSIVLTLLFVASCVPRRASQAAEPRSSKESLAALRSSVGVLGNVVIDLGATDSPVPLDASRIDDVGLRTLAVRMGRVFERDKSTCLLRMPRADEPQHSDDLMAAIVGRIPPEVLAAGLTTGLRFSDVPSAYRADLIAASGLSPAAAQNIELHPNATFIRFSVGAVADISSGKGPQEIPVFGERCYIPARLRNGTEPPPAVTAPAGPPSISTSHRHGLLDFGKGSVKTLVDIAEMAGKAFGQTYTVDKRLKGERFFLSGAYSMEEFAWAFDRLTTLSPLSRGARSRVSMIRRLCRQALAVPDSAAGPTEPDAQQLLSGRELSADAFSRLTGQTSQIASQLGLGQDASIVLKPVFNITVDDGLPGALNKTIMIPGY